MSTVFRKILTATLALVIAFGVSYGPLLQPVVPKPQTAHALLGVGDTAFEINPAVVGGVVTTAGASTVTAAATTIQSTILTALNGLAWTIAKMTVQSLTRSVVNWINSGFQGSPAFVSDLNENLKYLGDAVADDFIAHLDQTVQDTTGFNITSPFQDQLNQKLREEYYRTTSSWGLNYTLPQQSTDPKAFINGDFNKGGFNAYLSASQNQANNPFGAYMQASDQLWSQVGKAAQQRKMELDWGKGFLPWRGNCNTTPGIAGGAVSLSQKEKCPLNAVRTPGAVIEAQLENSLGSGVRQLELADSINEIVGALIGQLVNQVLGAGGLLGTSQPSSGGGSSYLERATNPSSVGAQTTGLAAGVVQNIANDRASYTTYRQNWQKILTAAKDAETTCGVSDDITAVTTKASTEVTRVDGVLTKLTEIETQVSGASTALQQTATRDTTAQILAAMNSYQTFLGSKEVPTPSERAEATVQSAENSGDETSTPSLYTQMLLKKQSCGG
jgi:hypothetical protein